MGTPIRSERDNQPTPASTDSSATSQDPPPNPNPSDGVTDPPAGDPPETEEVKLRRYSAILEETLREQNRTIQALQNGQRPAAPAAPAPPPRDPQAERQEFYNEPMEATRRIVRTELEQTVAPLLEFVKEFKGQGVSDRLKNTVKNDPRFSGMWDADVERAVDDTLSRVKPESINEDIVRSAAVQAIGLKAMNLLPTSAAPAPPAPTPPAPAPAGERRVTSPAHMRPSAPPAPSAPNGKPALRPLTENEERLRREQKISHEDFLFWQNLPASEVTTAIPPSKRGK
jgi:hypothetical protein